MSLLDQVTAEGYAKHLVLFSRQIHFANSKLRLNRFFKSWNARILLHYNRVNLCGLEIVVRLLQQLGLMVGRALPAYPAGTFARLPDRP